MASVPDMHEWTRRWLRGQLKGVRRGRASPNAVSGSISLARKWGLSDEEIRFILQEHRRLSGQ